MSLQRSVWRPVVDSASLVEDSLLYQRIQTRDATGTTKIGLLTVVNGKCVFRVEGSPSKWPHGHYLRETTEWRLTLDSSTYLTQKTWEAGQTLRPADSVIYKHESFGAAENEEALEGDMPLRHAIIHMTFTVNTGTPLEVDRALIQIRENTSQSFENLDYDESTLEIEALECTCGVCESTRQINRNNHKERIKAKLKELRSEDQEVLMELWQGFAGDGNTWIKGFIERMTNE